MEKKQANMTTTRAVAAMAASATLLTAGMSGATSEPIQVNNRPNIIFILADDIGYGDFSCYGATQVRTPNIDRLAKEGLRFTDAHSPSAVCTPTRYAFLTGEYAWRKQGTGILPGNAGLIIDPGRMTVPALLKQAGYVTGVVGKWHLGLGTTPTDYNGEVKPGPLEIGFDYAWLLPATGDRVPCVWLENRRVVNLDPSDPIRLDYTVKRGKPRSFVNGIPRIGEQVGGKAALWKDDQIADVIAEKSVAFIAKNKDKPFFLYLPTHDNHVPRVPHARFRGTSQAGVRGDAIHSFDWTVGRVMEALEAHGLKEKTLLIVTSDNGGTLDSNGPDTVNSGTKDTNNGHLYNGALRAGKGSIYEGGSRIPFVVRWPGHVQVGESGALLSFVDMLATFAALTGQTLPADAAPDSFNLLSSLCGSDKAGREHLVIHGHENKFLALRQGRWKYIAPRGQSTKRLSKSEGAETVQLFDLVEDIGEKKDVASAHPEVVAKMAALLKKNREDGRSRP